MSAIQTLKERLEEIESVLESTRELEKRQRANARGHFQKRQLIASLRATAYVMLYSAIEEAMRETMKSIREKIQSENILFDKIADYWRLDVVQAEFLDRMQNGTNHGNVLLELIPLTNSIASWGEKKRDRLPFSGNFGQDSAFRLRDGLNLAWVAPSGTLGGVDLENVRERRNALTHGLESFSETGGKVTAKDLLAALGRVERFMLSLIIALDEYRDKKGYVKQ